MKTILSFLILFLLFPSSVSAETFVLPSSMVMIGEEAFANTTSLDSIFVPEGTEYIGSRAFSGSSVHTLTLPSTITLIEKDAFSGCNLQEIICPPDSYVERYCIEYNLPYRNPIIYPEKSITAICPWAAGGGTDATLRALCQAMEDRLDVTLTVDNVTGGGGIIGHQSLANADPDGYSLGMITSELSTYQHLGISDLSYLNYDPLCLISTDAAAITVNADWADANGITNLASFIQYCKSHPDEVKMGSSINTSFSHIAGGYLMNAAGIELQIVTYQEGAATAVQNAASGFIQGLTVSLREARVFIESGHLVCLGVMDTQRNNLFPNVPTCKEQGYDFTFGSYRGLALPKGVDDEIRTILANACAQAVTSSKFITFMDNSGYVISYMDSDNFGTFLTQQHSTVKNALEILGY